MSEKDVLINRREAIEAFENRKWFKPPFSLKVVKHILYSLPDAEPKRKRGRWMESDTDGFVCSVCRNGYKMQPTIMGEPMFEFCPCCGAYMRGGEQDDSD